MPISESDLIWVIRLLVASACIVGAVLLFLRQAALGRE